jgi:hypothetical protein
LILRWMVYPAYTNKNFAENRKATLKIDSSVRLVADVYGFRETCLA